MACVKDVVHYLEQVAPLAYQESYDNSGLLVGDDRAELTGILISLDITEEVLQEAQAKKCNLIIAHHPLIFQPLYHLTGQGQVAKCLTYAVKNDLAIYALHTNLDNISGGVSAQLGKVLGLKQLSVLHPQANTLTQLTTFVPTSVAATLRSALHAAGAGTIGDYRHCSFSTSGVGRFKPTAAAYTGTARQLAEVEEERLEVTFPSHLEQPILAALHAAHPYQEVVYHLHQLKNITPQVGAGMLGMLPQPLDSQAFLAYLKTQLNLSCIRHSAPVPQSIERVAVCGGSGGNLMKQALQQGVDAFVTADLKYHDFFQAEGGLLIADVGHYESEVGTKTLVAALLSEKFASIAVLQCETVTNPIYYF